VWGRSAQSTDRNTCTDSAACPTPRTTAETMNLQWTGTNTLSRSDLRGLIRSGKGIRCAVVNCAHRATDIHHLDGDHSNDAPSNLAPACKRCHNAEHAISAQMSDLKLLTRLFYEAQAQRKAAANRVKAYEALQIGVPTARQALYDAREYEQHLKSRVVALLRQDSFYNAWLSGVKGVGPLLAASLLSELGSAQRFDTVSALWSYCGLGVKHGHALRRRKATPATWSPRLRTTMWKVASQFVRSRTSFGRQVYDRHKQYYCARDAPRLAKGHIDNRARRRVAKDFLRCLWVAWRRHTGLAVTEPRQGTWPMPEDWIRGNE
jgi:hypothetical protein